jgi:hypothetical protein
VRGREGIFVLLALLLSAVCVSGAFDNYYYPGMNYDKNSVTSDISNGYDTAYDGISNGDRLLVVDGRGYTCQGERVGAVSFNIYTGQNVVQYLGPCSYFQSPMVLENTIVQPGFGNSGDHSLHTIQANDKVTGALLWTYNPRPCEGCDNGANCLAHECPGGGDADEVSTYTPFHTDEADVVYIYAGGDWQRGNFTLYAFTERGSGGSAVQLWRHYMGHGAYYPIEPVIKGHIIYFMRNNKMVKASVTRATSELDSKNNPSGFSVLCESPDLKVSGYGEGNLVSVGDSIYISAYKYLYNINANDCSVSGFYNSSKFTDSMHDLLFTGSPVVVTGKIYVTIGYHNVMKLSVPLSDNLNTYDWKVYYSNNVGPLTYSDGKVYFKSGDCLIVAISAGNGAQQMIKDINDLSMGCDGADSYVSFVDIYNGMTITSGQSRIVGLGGFIYDPSATTTTTSTTTSSTTTVPTSGIKKCFQVNNLENEDSVMTGAMVVMFTDKDDFNTYRYCYADAYDKCCITGLTSDPIYQLYATKSGYFDFMIPVTAGAYYSLRVSDLGPLPNVYTIYLSPFQDNPVCIYDYPGVRLLCHYINYDFNGIKVPRTLELWKWSDSGTMKIWSKDLPAVSWEKLDYAWNTPECDAFGGLLGARVYTYDSNYDDGCIRTRTPLFTMLNCDNFPQGFACDKSRYFRSWDLDTAEVFSYVFVVRFQTYGSDHSTLLSDPVSLLNCYKDSDCDQCYLAQGAIGDYNCPALGAAVCDVSTHRCTDPFRITNIATKYKNDRPTVYLDWYGANGCKSAPDIWGQCEMYSEWDIKYRVFYKVPYGVFKEVYGSGLVSGGGTSGYEFTDEYMTADEYGCKSDNSLPNVVDGICRNYIGSEYIYSVRAYAGGKWISTSPEMPVVISNCAQQGGDSDLQCSSYSCLEPGGWGCGTVECRDRECSADANCQGCYSTNGNGLRSSTFCYKTPGQSTGICRPEFKGCTEDNDCVGGVGNSIYKYNDQALFCNKKLQSVLETQSWSKGDTLSYADVFASAVCLRKIIDNTDCVEDANCASGNCNGGGLLSYPALCDFFNTRNDLTWGVSFSSHTDCNPTDSNIGYCYSDTLVPSSDEFTAVDGLCYRLGTCMPRDVKHCAGTSERGDVWCQGVSGLNDRCAYCDDIDEVCMPCSTRMICGGVCMRDSWCMVGTTCDIIAGRDRGMCLLPTTKDCVGVSTTLPNKGCPAAECRYQTVVNGKSYPFKNKLVNGKVVICIDGWGCPSPDGAGGYLKNDDGSYRYDGCGCGENMLCIPNKPTDARGFCYDLKLDGQYCDKDGSVGGWHGDNICRSTNCMGDSWEIMGAMCTSKTDKCKSNAGREYFDEILGDPEFFCHCEPSSNGGSVGGPDGSSPPCSNIYTASKQIALDNIRSNFKWCYNEPLTLGTPAGRAIPDLGCYDTFSAGSECSESYQCASQLCLNGKCSSDDKDNLLGDPCTVKNRNKDTSTKWDAFDNGESDDPLWYDDCSDTSVAGPLYCDPCDHITGKIWDTTTSCAGYSVNHLERGRCQRAFTDGKWCYSHSQCNNEITGSGDSVTMLSCKIDGSNPENCDPTNKFCISGQRQTYNKHCLSSDVGKCTHDNELPYDIFDRKRDDLCYVKQYETHEIKFDLDMFCDDHQQCVDPSDGVTKNCEEIPSFYRDSATHILGTCKVNYCGADTGPYLTRECSRAPGFFNYEKEFGYHVAYAGNDILRSLVYCDGTAGRVGSTDEGGLCKWRKEKGSSCSVSVECMPNLACISLKCADKSCKDNSNCGADEECINGNCQVKGKYGTIIRANNGLSKPANSPFGKSYDFVVSCDMKDYVFTYTSDAAIRMKYRVGDEDGKFDTTEPIWFGGGKDVVARSMSGEIDLCARDNGLIRNSLNPSHVIYTLQFIPIINDKEDKPVITKRVLVLARSLDIKKIRCDGSVNEDRCNVAGREAFVIRQNNTLVSNGANIDDSRAISCAGSKTAGGVYEDFLYPRLSDTDFPNLNYARVDNWANDKFFRCVDQYGTVVTDTFLTNPAEWLFGLKFNPYEQLFLILLVLLGIPTLVLAGSRARK